MKVAVVGAGLAGLGAAYFLIEQGIEVTLFDAKGIGAGASGVCSGLLHPYPGLSAKRSREATEALELTRQLIAEAEGSTPLALREGILRRAINKEQLERLQTYDDVERQGEDLFLIKSGMTVFCQDYLEALASLLQKKGMELKIEKFHNQTGFDRVLLACGEGIRHFAQLPVEFLKGQLLCYEGESPHPKSYISRGYIAKTRSGFEVGSTYERKFASSEPCEETAQKLLPAQSGKLVCVKAGVRVCPIGTYLPLAQQLKDNVFIFTGLGSRGLLYHALFGKKVAQMIANS